MAADLRRVQPGTERSEIAKGRSLCPKGSAGGHWQFVALAVQEWIGRRGFKTLYIKPGSPWQNAYSESFNSRFRDEFLNRESFASVLEAKVLGKAHRHRHNHERPTPRSNTRPRWTSKPNATNPLTH